MELDHLIATLLAVTTAPPDPEGMPVSNDTADLLSTLMNWPAASRFPAVDLVRTFLLYASPANSQLLLTLGSIAGQAQAGDKDAETNAMLALRGLSNAFSTYKGAQTLVEVAQPVLEKIRKKRASLNKNGKVALATVALKFVTLASDF